MSYRYLFFRNCLCCALALWLIATGKVRRARQHALSGGVVTGVYFHNPKPRHFTRCINWLVRQGYAFVSERDVLDMLVHGKQLPSGAVWVSFDDGSRELLGNALPMLCERGIPATIFLPTGIVSGDGLFPWLNKSKPQSHYQPGQLCRDAMTVAEAKELASSREFTIGSHTVSHTPVSLLEEREVRFEVEESKRILESWTQAKVECLAYPEGLFSGAEKVVLAECGYQMAATTENDFITANTDPYLVPRYNVPDDVWFPEAICHMVGVWRPAIEPIITVLRSAGRFFKPRQTTQTTEVPPSESPQSVCWEEVK